MPASAYLLLAACLALPYVMRLVLVDMRTTTLRDDSRIGQLATPTSVRVTNGWIPVRVVDAECVEVRHA